MSSARLSLSSSSEGAALSSVSSIKSFNSSFSLTVFVGVVATVMPAFLPLFGLEILVGSITISNGVDTVQVEGSNE